MNERQQLTELLTDFGNPGSLGMSDLTGTVGLLTQLVSQAAKSKQQSEPQAEESQPTPGNPKRNIGTGVVGFHEALEQEIRKNEQLREQIANGEQREGRWQALCNEMLSTLRDAIRKDVGCDPVVQRQVENFEERLDVLIEESVV